MFYNSCLHKTTLLRNMIPTSGLRLLYYGQLYTLDTLKNSSKNYDAYKWRK